MTNKPLTIKTPGKLMIAGEFAVLVPNQRIVVMAVNRYVYTTIQEDMANTLTLETFKLQHLKWDYIDNKVHIHSEDRRINYVENAMTTVITYLKENDIQVKPFHLSVRSELDDASGVKYGLGSSAAVVTSVTAAILKMFLPTAPSGSLIFKLAAIPHVKTQGNGSGADIAASTFGGILAYTSFQADWLKEAIEDSNSLTELVDENWTYWSVEPVRLPEAVHMSIGWTGTPASTSHLVGEILALRNSSPATFEAFLEMSDLAVTSFLRGAKTGDIPDFLSGVKMNRQALVDVGNETIETPLLCTLADSAEQYGGAGKPSGAGGGDCGIAFLPSQTNAGRLADSWEQNGIKPLGLTVSEFGSVTLE